MIKSLKLTNFRAVRSADMTFDAGMVCLKGANEASKSTRLEAIQYALFGSSALRTNFADAVTYGEAESTLKVECNAVFGGRAVTFKRGKSGAEVIENGNVIVTGQKECGIFAASLMGADAAAATNLLIANQGSLRGVLEQGPKATSQFVEQLANFDLFDTLIEKMQTKLMLGNTTAIEAEVAAAQQLLEITPQPTEPDFAALEAATSSATTALATKQVEYDPSVARVAAAAKAVNAAADRILTRNKVLQDIADADRRVARIEADKSASQAAANVSIDKAELDSLREHVANAKLAELKLAAYKRLFTLPKLAARWGGGRDSLVAEIDSIKKALRDSEATYHTDNTKRSVLRSTLVTSSACGFCGQDISQWPQVAEKNAQVERGITEIDARMAAAEVKHTAMKAEIAELNSVLEQGREFDWAASHPEWIDIDATLYPPLLSWKGAAPIAAKIDEIVTRLHALEAAEKSAFAAKSKLSVYERELTLEAVTLIGLAAKLSDYASVDTDMAAAEANHTAEERHHTDLTLVLTEMASNVWTASQALETARLTYTSAKSAYDAANQTLTSRKGLLETMQFNNALLKKVRSARPIVSDKLWNTVLHSVSTMFSRMRGETSLVLKDNGGFKVNGQSVESLSGSTLDILALAIRVSLIKVFLPNSNFLLLDEITAACDFDRSTSMYGFLKAAEFDQVLLVTHDSIAESIADQLIEL